MRCYLLAIVFLTCGLSFGAEPSLTQWCAIILGRVARDAAGDQDARRFQARLDRETDRDVKEFAAIIHDDVERLGAFTEMGAHGQDSRGNNLSWKWLGVGVVGEGAQARYRVVGYGNPQNYRAPFDRQALQGEIPQIAVGTNIRGEMYVDGRDLAAIPEATRTKVLRALQLAFNPPRLRVIAPGGERQSLESGGSLPPGRDASRRAGMSLSVVSGNDAGLSLWSLAPEAPGRHSAMRLTVDPGEPVIVGRQSGGRIPYLDESYRSTNIAPGGTRVAQGNDLDGNVSRAHFMVESDPRGLVLVNGVPGADGHTRPPIHGTFDLTPTRTVGSDGTVVFVPNRRRMREVERLPIPSGTSIQIELPNRTVIEIKAD